MHVTICGGGNAAHTLVSLLGRKEEINVSAFLPYGNEAQLWQEGVAQTGGIVAHTPKGLMRGRPTRISAQASDVIPDSDLIILALPAFAHRTVLETIAPYVREGSWLVAMPARNGFLWDVQDVWGEHLVSGGRPLIVVGLQTLPWACRVRQYGKEVDVLGTKRVVDVAVWPPDVQSVVVGTLASLLEVHLEPVGNFLALGLADVGQIIHPGIMYGLFHSWDGTPYLEPPLFYQGMDESTAAILDAMSREILAVRDVLARMYPQLDFQSVRHVGEWIRRTYRESIRDDSTLQRCFVTNESYRGLRAPMLAVDGGFVPDFKARYLSEDVPYGLLVTRGIAELVGVETPTIDRVILWAQGRLGKEYLREGRVAGRDVAETRAPQRYGIKHVVTWT